VETTAPLLLHHHIAGVLGAARDAAGDVGAQPDRPDGHQNGDEDLAFGRRSGPRRQGDHDASHACAESPEDVDPARVVGLQGDGPGRHHDDDHEMEGEEKRDQHDQRPEGSS
jgi:hypothetical protein